MSEKMAVALDDRGLAFLRAKLKTGEYDGEDIMNAWMAMDELLNLREENRRLRDSCSKAASVGLKVGVEKSDRQKMLEEQGHVFRSQELMDRHEADPSVECFCGRPGRR